MSFPKFIAIFILWFTLAASANESKETKILVMGDSLSAAYNMELDNGWVNLLQNFVQKKYPVDILNASISGETTSGGLNRLPSHLKNFSPDIVIIELGGNDGLRGFDLERTKENLHKLVNLSLNSGAKVLLAGIKIPPNYGRTYTHRFEKIYTDLAQIDNVELIPFFLEGVGGIGKFMQYDGIHPNKTAQPILMQNVWKHLKPMLETSK